MPENILIVGGGQAGLEIACSLRENNFSGNIQLVCEEEYFPYQRPPLSKSFLLDESTQETLLLRSGDFYEKNGIEVKTNCKLDKIWFDGVQGFATPKSGQLLNFDKLAITTGSQPRKLTIPGNQLDGVFYVRGISDIRKIKTHWDSAKNILVIGGGYIGLELAAVAEKSGKNVVIAERSSQILRRSVSQETSDYLRQKHTARGAKVLLDCRVLELLGSESKVKCAKLDNGEVLDIDLVIVGIGAEPRIELAEQLNLEISPAGIKVDEFGITSNPLVVAAGDCASFDLPRFGLTNYRLESVQNATDQAAIAAKSLLGKFEPYDPVPWFWSDQAETKLQIAGISAGSDTHVLRGSPYEDKFSVFYFKNQKLRAIESINHPAEFTFVRKLMTQGRNLTIDRVFDTSIPLKELALD